MGQVVVTHQLPVYSVTKSLGIESIRAYATQAQIMHFRKYGMVSENTDFLRKDGLVAVIVTLDPTRWTVVAHSSDGFTLQSVS